MSIAWSSRELRSPRGVCCAPVGRVGGCVEVAGEPFVPTSGTIILTTVKGMGTEKLRSLPQFQRFVNERIDRQAAHQDAQVASACRCTRANLQSRFALA